jgi:hypothetical protein
MMGVAPISFSPATEPRRHNRRKTDRQVVSADVAESAPHHIIRGHSLRGPSKKLIDFGSCYGAIMCQPTE